MTPGGANTGITTCGGNGETGTSMTGCSSSAGCCRGCGERVSGDLAGRGLRRERVLAAAVRLIDLGFFRPGGEDYAAENGTFGIATIWREHVTCRRGELVFDYLAKGAKHREQAVVEADVQAVVVSLRRRKGGGDGLFGYRSGRGWHDMTAADINAYLGEISGDEFTAKDFRTWHATVLAAVGLAVVRMLTRHG
jgi:DNA topoisomerase IB